MSRMPKPIATRATSNYWKKVVGEGAVCTPSGFNPVYCLTVAPHRRKNVQPARAHRGARILTARGKVFREAARARAASENPGASQPTPRRLLATRIQGVKARSGQTT